MRFDSDAVLALAAVLFLASSAQAAEPRDLSGDYVMKGKGVQAEDRAYSGTCAFKAEGTLYDVSCFNSDTRHTYSGKGLALGDQFSIVIGDLLKGDHQNAYVGEYLVVYRVSSDGSLAGRWVHALSGAHGNETLTPKK